MTETTTEPQTLTEAVQQAIGRATMSWQNVAAAGIFDEKAAAATADELLAWIDRHIGRAQPQAIDSDPELFHGLTVWTDSVSMQVRDDGVALHVMEGATRSPEHLEPVLIPKAEARRIRDLLNIATARGEL